MAHNRFYGEGSNIGVEASRGRYVVLLHNDALVTAKWLELLIVVFDNKINAGGVGAKLVFPSGRLQEAGAFLDEQGILVQRGKLYDLEESENRVSIVDYCSSACFMTSREIFDRVSGFDPIFEPRHYKDVDFVLRSAVLASSSITVQPPRYTILATRLPQTAS